MKVIFVGIHNKPGLPPLCSTTKSGKLIDRIIAEIDAECVKTNLYNRESIPETGKLMYAIEWLKRNLPVHNAVVILLGKEVSAHFWKEGKFKAIIEAHHPASKRSHIAMDEYVKSVVSQIKEKL